MPETSLPLIVFHYTTDNQYASEVKNLIASLDRLGLAYLPFPINSIGDWRANSNWCSQSILMALDVVGEGGSILRVDADAVFHSVPDIFVKAPFNRCDYAACIHTFRWRANELLGGTLFFRNTPEVKEAVRIWNYLCNECPETKNRRNGDLLNYLRINHPKFSHLHFQQLPPTYCQIFDHMKDVGIPVIEHMQASRRFKNFVNAQARREK